MNVTYREVETADAKGLMDFLKTVGNETDNLSFSGESLKLTLEAEKRFITRFKANKKNLMLIAECDGEIVGNASVERNRTPRYSHRAELSIVVKKDFWGQGIGTRLMELLIEFSKESGVEILELEVRGDNERAIKLYEKFGFYAFGNYKNYFKINNKYYDALLMSLHF